MTLALPQPTQPLATKGVVGDPWYRYFAGLFSGVPPAPESGVKIGPSPFTFTAARGGSLIVNGGAVSVIQFARSATRYTTGATQGMFPLSQGDSLTIQYSMAPTLTFVPQ